MTNILVEHKLTANDIDLLIERLEAYELSRISYIVNSNNTNYNIFYNYNGNLATVDIFPSNNDWIKYISSFTGTIEHLKIRLLTSNTFDLAMADKQNKAVNLSTDIWNKDKAAKRISEHNEVASENMKVTDTEVAIIEAARNKLTN